jgi:exodeoxyribonuclease VII large subunit
LPPHLLERARERFGRSEGILRVLGPDATLRRGYSITKTAQGNVIRSTAEVRPRMELVTRVADGEFTSEVREKKDRAD